MVPPTSHPGVLQGCSLLLDPMVLTTTKVHLILLHSVDGGFEDTMHQAGPRCPFPAGMLAHCISITPDYRRTLYSCLQCFHTAATEDPDSLCTGRGKCVWDLPRLLQLCLLHPPFP